MRRMNKVHLRDGGVRVIKQDSTLAADILRLGSILTSITVRWSLVCSAVLLSVVFLQLDVSTHAPRFTPRIPNDPERVRGCVIITYDLNGTIDYGPRSTKTTS